MSRPSSDEYFLQLAEHAATRGTCARRKVGCILVDLHGHIIGTGYNGVAAGLDHCIDKPCPGAGQPSGQGLHLCEALHAEENALIQCRDTSAIFTVYCTASPCLQCVRRLLNTSARVIVFREEYPHPTSKSIWLGQGRDWIHLPREQNNDSGHAAVRHQVQSGTRSPEFGANYPVVAKLLQADADSGK